MHVVAGNTYDVNGHTGGFIAITTGIESVTNHLQKIVVICGASRWDGISDKVVVSGNVASETNVTVATLSSPTVGGPTGGTDVVNIEFTITKPDDDDEDDDGQGEDDD